jgi:hypothetical protein
MESISRALPITFPQVPPTTNFMVELHMTFVPMDFIDHKHGEQLSMPKNSWWIS